MEDGEGFFFSPVIQVSCEKSITAQCGETVSGTCKFTKKLEHLNVKWGSDKSIDFDFNNGGEHTENSPEGKVSVEVTGMAVTINIINATFSEAGEFILAFSSRAGHRKAVIRFSVVGVCDPIINFRESGDLICEVNSSRPVQISWSSAGVMEHTGTDEEPLEGKFRTYSSLHPSNRTRPMCCVVVDGDGHLEKQSCTNYSDDHQLASYDGKKKPVAVQTILPVPAVALVGIPAFVWYKCRSRRISMSSAGFRERRTSQGPLIGPEEKDQSMKDPTASTNVYI
ncbi:uncharacterized protein LOC128470957 [Spea bombifrons]|uniref:uncharacterized protein LOC128470957 n=1 Tax=Spea bombifrons TaxID=233779 RepID=UPI00234B30C0|nr:uncharacterized protein LOC128470957 [Spea bombifrons]